MLTAEVPPAPFDFVTALGNTDFGGIEHTNFTRPATIIAAAEHAIERDIGLFVIGRIHIDAEQAASVLAEPYRDRRPDGLVLYGAGRPLSLPDGTTPVVAADCDGEWVVTVSGELEYRLDGTVRIAGPVDAPLTAFDVDTPILSSTDDGYVLSNATGTRHERFTDRDAALANRQYVQVPAVPSQPEYLSVLPALELTYEDQNSLTTFEYRPPWVSQGVDDDMVALIQTMTTFTDRYTTTGDGLPVKAFTDRFRAWVEILTNRETPPNHVLGQLLPGRNHQVTDDVQPMLSTVQWTIEPGRRSPLFPGDRDGAGGDGPC